MTDVATHTYTSPLPSEALHTLWLITQEGSFERAAALLGVSPSAVSQRIKSLEDHLGRAVLHRTRPVRATAAGLTLLRFVEQSQSLEIGALSQLETSARSGPHLVFSIALESDLRRSWIAALHGAERPADTDLRILDADRSDDLLVADVILSRVPQPPSGWVSEELGRLRFGAYCKPDTAPVGSRSLGAEPSVRLSNRVAAHAHFAEQTGIVLGRAPQVVVPSTELLLEAVLMGMGWALLPVPIARPHVDQGDLVLAWPAEGPAETLYWHHPRANQARIEWAARAVRGLAGRILETDWE